MAQKETRVLQASGLRVASGPSGQKQVIGYAAVFDQLSLDLGGFREKIERGTFSKSLAGDDVRALWNHDPSVVLGRTKSGTLHLAEDAHGLRFVIDMPDTAAARDLIVSMQRGDVDGASFGFEAIRDRWDSDGRGAIRTLLEARLFDVSPVCFPAYPQTSAEARQMARAVARPARRSRNERARRRNLENWVRLYKAGAFRR